MKFCDELAVKYPKRSTAAREGRSRRSAIILQCIECVGSYSEAKRCESRECWLWPYGPAGIAAKVTP